MFIFEISSLFPSLRNAKGCKHCSSVHPGCKVSWPPGKERNYLLFQFLGEKNVYDIMKSNLQDPYPGSQGNAQLLQPFLRKVGQLKHPNLCLLKDTSVLLVPKVL